MVKKLIAVMVVLMGLTLAAAVPAEEVKFPAMFDEVREYLKSDGYDVSEDIRGLEIMVPDNTIEEGGTVMLIAGVGPKGIGCGKRFLDAERIPLLGFFLYYFPEQDAYVMADTIRRTQEVYTEEQAQKTVTEWLESYKKAVKRTKGYDA